MIKKNKTIELLAPAKNKECAFAAINAGADAIYIGADSFGARKNAGNSLDDIREIVDFAHKFNVKIYITLNTILFDEEVKEVEKLVWELYEIGVDAIIFQDFSFFEMNLPPITLHASTQCNNNDLEKIKFLKDMKVDRVVLPREFSLNQIKEVISNADIETEVFIHGALCVSYSGQCYLSHHIGGRSANRGECAQPCRKKYSMIDDKGNLILEPQYLLSMKDNNLAPHIKELYDAGVTSLKIEGRLKDKEYVTNVTAYYRNLLDTISNDISPAFGIIKHNDFEPDLEKTFNRTFTDFYFDEKRKHYINPKTPKFIGEYIGTVKSISGKAVKLDKKTTINVSDKLCYYAKDGDLSGTTVTKIANNCFEVLNINELKAGTKLYRNFDSDFNKKLNNANFKRKLPISIDISNTEISIHTVSGISVKYPLSEEYEKANDIQKAKENAIKQFSKLGDTDFICYKSNISDDFDRFIPISKLNELRRAIIANLEIKIQQEYKTTKRIKPTHYPQYPYDKTDYSFNISNNKAKIFYEKCGTHVEEYAIEKVSATKDIILMKTKHCLRYQANMCKKTTHDKKELFLVDEFNVKYPLSFDCKNCIMNIHNEFKT